MFDGEHDRPDAIEAWWQHRGALIFVLRSRAKVKIQEEPELRGTWEGYMLPDRDSPTLRELCVEEAEHEGEDIFRVGSEGRVEVGERLGTKKRK